MPRPADALRRLAEQASLNAAEQAAFERYLGAILDAGHNVTALDSADAIVDELFLDALAARSLLEGVDGPLIDVGTGAGVPGVPLAIVDPSRELVLLDATEKKAAFVAGVAADLRLANVTARAMRAEEAGRDSDMREHFAVATAKAVASLRVLVEWLVPLVRPDGIAICWKGPSAQAEVDDAQAALQALGAQVERLVPYRVPGREERCLVVLRRCAPLPERYPRRVGVASKRPL